MKERLVTLLEEAKVARVLLTAAAAKLERMVELPQLEAEIKRLRRLAAEAADRKQLELRVVRAKAELAQALEDSSGVATGGSNSFS